MQRYPVLSLFSGIAQLCCGGIKHAGLSDRFQVKYFVECNQYRQRLLQRLLYQNHPRVNLWGDVQTFRGQSGQFFVVVGGSPCQDNSGANAKGKGLAGDRSGLWWEQLRIIQECRPAIILWENPAGCKYPKDESPISPLGMVLWSLQSSGYVCQWQSIRACDVGAPHERDRVFVIAYSAHLFQRFGVVPSPWAGQIGDAVEVIANADDLGAGRTEANQAEAGAEPGIRIKEIVADTDNQRCKTREDEQEFQLSVCGQEGGCTDSTGLCLTPSPPGMDDGAGRELNSYHRTGWWKENPFTGDVAVPQRSLPNRGDRIAALGDSCTPQQAAVCWKYIDYLTRSLELAANQG